MTKEKLNTKELFAVLDETSAELLEPISSANEEILNKVPFKDSWTAAQLASHVTKSNKAIVNALSMEGKADERNADERVQELKGIFLDFTSKFQSPEFIVPTRDVYEKEKLIDDFKRSVERLTDAGGKANLSEIISLPAFGEITKLELLHFVLYHTQRHIHQLKNILQIVNKKINDNGKS